MRAGVDKIKLEHATKAGVDEAERKEDELKKKDREIKDTDLGKHVDNCGVHYIIIDGKFYKHVYMDDYDDGFRVEEISMEDLLNKHESEDGAKDEEQQLKRRINHGKMRGYRRIEHSVH